MLNLAHSFQSDGNILGINVAIVTVQKLYEVFGDAFVQYLILLHVNHEEREILWVQFFNLGLCYRLNLFFVCRLKFLMGLGHIFEIPTDFIDILNGYTELELRAVLHHHYSLDLFMHHHFLYIILY